MDRSRKRMRIDNVQLPTAAPNGQPALPGVISVANSSGDLDPQASVVPLRDHMLHLLRQENRLKAALSEWFGSGDADYQERFTGTIDVGLDLPTAADLTSFPTQIRQKLAADPITRSKHRMTHKTPERFRNSAKLKRKCVLSTNKGARGNIQVLARYADNPEIVESLLTNWNGGILKPFQIHSYEHAQEVVAIMRGHMERFVDQSFLSIPVSSNQCELLVLIIIPLPASV